MLSLASIFLLAGMILPIMTIKKFIFLGSSFSIFSGISDLFVEGHYILSLVILVFSVLIPTLKIIIIYRILLSNLVGRPVKSRLLHLMHDFGRWSMLDVMVAAILFVAVKMNLVASVAIHYGLYVFILAILMLMYVTQRTVNLISKNPSLNENL